MQMNAEYQLVIILKNRKKKKRQFQNLLHVANYVARGKLTNHKSQNNPSKWQNLTKQKSGCCWIERKDMNFEQKWRREEGGGERVIPGIGGRKLKMCIRQPSSRLLMGDEEEEVLFLWNLFHCSLLSSSSCCWSSITVMLCSSELWTHAVLQPPPPRTF